MNRKIKGLLYMLPGAAVLYGLLYLMHLDIGWKGVFIAVGGAFLLMGAIMLLIHGLAELTDSGD